MGLSELKISFLSHIMGSSDAISFLGLQAFSLTM